MQKRFSLYAIVWVVLLALFNVIAFVSVGWISLEKYTASFWIGYVFIIVAFLGQLFCAYLAFKADSAKKMFYNISLLKTSYIGLVACFVVGGICMLISPLPYWIGAIMCAIITALNILSVVKATSVKDEVLIVDEKVEKATAFIYYMREESESLFARVKSENLKPVCKKVRDAFKFSDPMSNTELAYIEADIKTHFDLLKKAIAEGKMDVAASESEELLALISERNNTCKRLK